jgi:hypothetical protein
MDGWDILMGIVNIVPRLPLTSSRSGIRLNPFSHHVKRPIFDIIPDIVLIKNETEKRSWVASQ